jgi:hypothetical protein
MRNRLHRAALALGATLVACTQPFAQGEPSFLTASVAGSIEASYTGSGTFMILPDHTPGPHFLLHSVGTGTASSQGFAFHAPKPPGAGDHPFGELAAGAVRATYWYDQRGVRKIFRAESGTIRLTEATAERAGGRLSGRVSGTFELSARLLYVCAILPGFPGSFIECETAGMAETVHIGGSFSTGPTGGDSPGLQLGGI